jgi:hypothetical protein
MFESELLAKLYIEPRPLTEEWLYMLLSRLWERGQHYNYNYATAPLTWDDELNVLADGVTDFDVYKGVQLSTLIQSIATAGAGSITMYDKEVALDLFIDPSGQSRSRYDQPHWAPTRFGQVALSINGSYLNTSHYLPLSRDVPEQAYLLAPYQQVMLAFAHWMEVLCEECNPVFAVGYDSNRESDEEVDDRETIEAPLYVGRLPDQTAWYPLTYISARFVDNDLILSLLTSPGRWLKRTKEGGIFMHTPYNEYAYENAEAYRQVLQGETAKKQHEFTRAIQHYQRAKGIFHRVSHDSAEWLSGRNIDSVDSLHKIEETELEKEETALFAGEDDGTETLAAQDVSLIPSSIAIRFLRWFNTYHPEIHNVRDLSSSNIMYYVHEFERDTGIRNEYTADDWIVSLRAA